ncbi:LysR substrate-binding domain-containing protein [Parvibaculaceae bacterium PLY_AMNH_Bact1]|nr:LysR substrate-binding domain-containing protein [Parvibaculaceae bacterium PLY_AMNH_Bact1]
MSLPSLVALRAFDAAARLGSFKQAADALNVSATAISHHIRGLEAQIGVPLFLRGTRQVSLTDEGRQLSEATAFAFSRIEATLETLCVAENTLTISTTPAFASLWLAPRIQSFEAQHPYLRVRTVSSTDVVDLQRDRTIDAAIRYGEDGCSHDGWLTLRESVCAFGSPDYIRRLEHLSQAEFISTAWMSKDLKHTSWTDWFAAAEYEPDKDAKVREFLQEHEVLQAGLGGQGLILLSDVLAADMVARGWLEPYRPDICLEGLGYRVICGPQKSDSKKLKAFVAWLTKEIGSAETSAKTAAP